jgi:hypothetical protein
MFQQLIYWQDTILLHITEAMFRELGKATGQMPC